jgi:predicted HicB family RNase H-like nuclease
MSVDPGHYTYRVAWSPDDGEYVGTCLEFPSLSWVAKSSRAALGGIERVVADVVADLEGNEEPVPEPLAERPYSGTFNVRIPGELHRRLATEAAEQGISLNRLVSQRLAS